MTFTSRGLYASSSKEPRSRRGWLIVGGGVAAVVLVIGVANALAAFPTAKEERNDSFGDIEKIAVENHTSGDVRVTHTQGDEVTVDRTLRGSPVSHPSDKIDADGGTLRAKADCGGPISFFGGCAVDYEIGVPKGTKLDIDATSGEVRITGVHADATISANSGAVTTERVTGDVAASTNSGNIRVNKVKGSLNLKASSGSITADGSGDTVRAATSSGGVNLEKFNATNFNVQTSSGDANIEGSFEKAKVNSSSGAITITATEAFSRVETESSSGAVDLRVPEGEYDVSGSSSSGSRDIEVDQSRDASARIDTTTSSGSVTIRPVT